MSHTDRMVLSGGGDFAFETSKGKVGGHRIMRAEGEFESGTDAAAGEDVCHHAAVSGPALLPTPASAGEQMSVVSDSTDDDLGGIGAEYVRILYIDAEGEEQTETIELNGTTDVDTVATDIRFINDMHAIDSVGSNGVAVGNVTIRKKGVAVTTSLYCIIAAGGNQALVPHRMVPADKTLYLKEWWCTEAQGKRSAFRIRSTDYDGVLTPGIFLFKGVSYIKQNTPPPMSLDGVVCPALSIVKVSHWDDQSGAEGSCGWWGYLVDNGS